VRCFRQQILPMRVSISSMLLSYGVRANLLKCNSMYMRLFLAAHDALAGFPCSLPPARHANRRSFRVALRHFSHPLTASIFLMLLTDGRFLPLCSSNVLMTRFETWTEMMGAWYIST